MCSNLLDQPTMRVLVKGLAKVHATTQTSGKRKLPSETNYSSSSSLDEEVLERRHLNFHSGNCIVKMERGKFGTRSPWTGASSRGDGLRPCSQAAPKGPTRKVLDAAALMMQRENLLAEMGYPVIAQIISLYYPILAAIGVPVNLVAIVILSRGKCGLSKCITVYLVGMAAADLLVVISGPILIYIVLIYLPVSFLNITPVCSVIVVLFSASIFISVWLTVTFTIDRFVAICCEKLKTKYCTKKTAAVVVGTVSVLGCLENVPIYFILKPRYIIDNVPMDCIYKSSFFTSPAWEAFEWFHYILTPFIPVFLILLLNVLTVRRILFSSKVRRRFRDHSNGENQKDPEMENRRKSIILLFSISSSFVLLWMTKVVYTIYRRIEDSPYHYSYTDPHFIANHTSLILQALSSCTNTCIYAVTQTKFREELKNAVKYPFNLIVKSLKT
ncbi:probable G-protein coupled receptor 139 [Heterodontus francisci]|uniref:probable G-protein coupled receptor 139 n=1 Tax=Heterodontus francisci TaxID=7792 RepID=UPI00355BAE78